MKIYRSKETGATFYAEMPTAVTSLEFLKEAALYDMFLFKMSGFDPYLVDRWNRYFYYFKHNITDIEVPESEYLLLPTDPSIRKRYGKGAYLTCSSIFFKEKYELVESANPPVSPDPVQKSRLAGKSFYLDAGHGGRDPGAINDNLGLQEKIAALEICLKLGISLEKQGASVYYSRTGDTYPTLTERATQANSKNVDAFISIHLNSAENKTASGIETLCYSNTGKAFELAEAVQAELITATGFKNRGVKIRPELTVLAKTKMPAILCEVGFISNDDEAKKLFDSTIQEKMANAICAGVIEEFGN